MLDFIISEEVRKVMGMDIKLKERTRETVSIYFKKSQNPKIKAVLPQKAQSLEEALDDYEKTLLPSAASYGETIWVDDVYVGDIWCYCIDKNEEPNAMISFCIYFFYQVNYSPYYLSYFPLNHLLV